MKTDKPLNENWVMESRNVPTQFAHGWHGGMMPQAMMCSAPPQLKMMQLCSGGGPLFGGQMKKCKSRAKRCSDSSMSFGSSSPVFGASMDLRSFGSAFSPTSPLMPLPNMGSTGDRSMSVSSDFTPAEAEETASVTPLEKLISLQSFDGSFALDEKLCEILGRNLSELKKGTILRI